MEHRVAEIVYHAFKDTRYELGEAHLRGLRNHLMKTDPSFIKTPKYKL